MFGVTRPRCRILGSTVSGIVEGVGRDVAGCAPGQAVCAMTGTKLGAHAEFVAVSADRVVPVPAGVLLAAAGPWDNIRARGKVVAGSAPERVADIEFLLDLVASGDLTVVHDSVYGLEHIVDAYRRVDSGHKRGNVIVHP